MEFERDSKSWQFDRNLTEEDLLARFSRIWESEWRNSARAADALTPFARQKGRNKDGIVRPQAALLYKRGKANSGYVKDAFVRFLCHRSKGGGKPRPSNDDAESSSSLSVERTNWDETALEPIPGVSDIYAGPGAHGKRWYTSDLLVSSKSLEDATLAQSDASSTDHGSTTATATLSGLDHMKRVREEIREDNLSRQTPSRFFRQTGAAEEPTRPLKKQRAEPSASSSSSSAPVTTHMHSSKKIVERKTLLTRKVETLQRKREAEDQIRRQLEKIVAIDEEISLVLELLRQIEETDSDC